MSNFLSSGIDRRQFLQGGLALSALPLGSAQENMGATLHASSDDRQFWIETLKKISYPVLHALSERKLKERMPVEAANPAERKQFTYLEALGRLLCGMAPWLESGPESGEEGELRRQFAELARKGIQAATDPASPDFMNFDKGSQPVVDSAFLALAVIRAPKELWHKLDTTTQQNLIAALQSSRKILPGYSNWLLFSATVEAALCMMGVWWDSMRVDYAIRTVDTWYKGDGLYGDGPMFHSDYYNSFVIHPLLLNTLDVVSKSSSTWENFRQPVLMRAQRYAAIQERLIAPDGSFPAIGRSLCYRFGAFHLLAEMSLRHQLPEDVAPEQVRCALTTVMRRMLQAPGTFDEHGWLTLGFYGHQPSVAETYISTGSLYLCSAAWLPLGLPASDAFWAGPEKAWTAKRMWQGESIKADHAIADRHI